MTIFYNGKLYKNSEMYTAMAVSGGYIRAIGTDREIIEAYRGDTEACIDLEGRLVLPGFVDSHMHLLDDAVEQSYIDLSTAKSFEDVRSLCMEHLTDHQKSGLPLRAAGFNQNDWTNPQMPARDDLDSISTDIPVILQRTCHHITVCNTKALELFHGEERFPDGILKEDEQNELEAVLPPLTKSQIKDLIRCSALKAAAHGITAIHTDDLMRLLDERYGETIIDAYKELASSGELPIRIVEQCNLHTMERLSAFLDAGYRTGDATGLFSIGPLKLLGDGSLGARTAAMVEDYIDEPGNRGILNFDDEALYQLCSLAHKNGMQIAIHGIGDRAIRQILDIYEKIQAEYPRPDARHGIVHCQITSEDQLRRICGQDLIAYIQPAFIRADQHIAEARIGKELCGTSYDWRAMKDLGIHLCGGSDCPVESFDVLSGIYYAVMRKVPDLSEGWYPEKGLTLDEAIDLYTSEGAYAVFAEHSRGKIASGYVADFCVLDRDITTLPAESLLQVQVMMTVVNGEIIYTSVHESEAQESVNEQEF